MSFKRHCQLLSSKWNIIGRCQLRGLFIPLKASWSFLFLNANYSIQNGPLLVAANQNVFMCFEKIGPGCGEGAGPVRIHHQHFLHIYILIIWLLLNDNKFDAVSLTKMAPIIYLLQYLNFVLCPSLLLLRLQSWCDWLSNWILKWLALGKFNFIKNRFGVMNNGKRVLA